MTTDNEQNSYYLKEQKPCTKYFFLFLEKFNLNVSQYQDIAKF